MTEGISNFGQYSESVEKGSEKESAILDLQRKFKARYDSIFNPSSQKERQQTGSGLLASLDYVIPLEIKYIAYYKALSTLPLPYDPVISGIEELLERDRDVSFSPIKFHQENARLPIIKKGEYSRILGVLRDVPLYFVRRNFILLPDGDIQRSVEQIIVSKAKDSVEKGELWIGRKWKKLPVNGGSMNERKELVLSVSV